MESGLSSGSMPQRALAPRFSIQVLPDVGKPAKNMSCSSDSVIGSRPVSKRFSPRAAHRAVQSCPTCVGWGFPIDSRGESSENIRPARTIFHDRFHSRRAGENNVRFPAYASPSDPLSPLFEEWVLLQVNPEATSCEPLVQEFIRWFDEPPTSMMTDVAIRIR